MRILDVTQIRVNNYYIIDNTPACTNELIGEYFKMLIQCISIDDDKIQMNDISLIDGNYDFFAPNWTLYNACISDFYITSISKKDDPEYFL